MEKGKGGDEAPGDKGPLIEEVKSDENVKKGKTVTLDWTQIYDFKLTEK